MLPWLALVTGLALAQAAAEPKHAALHRAVAAGASTCTPKAGGDASVDDTPAIQSAIAKCASGTIVIPSGTTYHINSALSFHGCSGCTLQVDGTLQVSGDTNNWEGRQAIFLMDGITGATVVSKTGKGLIDGNGQAAWDRFSSKPYRRPTLFYITGSKNIVVQNMQFKDAPNVFHSVTGKSSDVKYIDVGLSAVSKSANTPQNTDGWDVGSASHVTISGAKVVNNDDCVAFKPGCSDVTVTDITCTGSHGLSVGSLGKGKGSTDTVENVLVKGATMIDSAKAVGIKLYPGGPNHGTAVVSNVTFEDVVVRNSDYAFQVQSCYGEDAEYCKKYPSTGKLTDVVVRNLSGVTSSKYKGVVDNINCPAGGSCGLTMSEITVKAPNGKTEHECANTPSGLGIKCASGASG